MATLEGPNNGNASALCAGNWWPLLRREALYEKYSLNVNLNHFQMWSVEFVEVLDETKMKPKEKKGQKSEAEKKIGATSSISEPQNIAGKTAHQDSIAKER